MCIRDRRCRCKLLNSSPAAAPRPALPPGGGMPPGGTNGLLALVVVPQAQGPRENGGGHVLVVDDFLEVRADGRVAASATATGLLVRRQRGRAHPRRHHDRQYCGYADFANPTHFAPPVRSVSYTHLRAHETPEHLVCRL